MDRRLVVAGFVWFAFMGLAVTMNGPLSEAMTPLLGQPASSQPQMGTAFFLGSALMLAANAAFTPLFVGAWVPRACTVSYALGNLICATTTNWPLFLVGLALTGAGNGGMSVWFNAEFARTFEGPRVGAWLTALNGFWAVGAVLGPYLVAQLVQQPRSPYIAVGVAALLSLPLAFLIRPRPAHDPTAEANVAAIPKLVYGLMVVLGIYVGAETSTIILMSRHLISVHGLSLAGAATVASGLWFAFMIGRFGVGPIAARVRPPLIIAGCAGLAICGLLMTTQPTLYWPGYVLLGISMGPIFPAVIAWGTGLSTAAHRVTSLMVLGPCVMAVALPASVAAALGAQISALPWVIIGFHALIASLSLLWGRQRLSTAEALP